MNLSRVNLSNATSVGSFLRNVLHDTGLSTPDLKEQKKQIAGLSMKQGLSFQEYALEHLRKGIAEGDRHEVKNLILILMDDGLSLEDIRDAVTD